ncbi:MAG: hypothetical protein QOH54_1495, partial [Mycobacterium sp.]|nr:hypothetical protein [Mycobacterium sp.]
MRHPWPVDVDSLLQTIPPFAVYI